MKYQATKALFLLLFLVVPVLNAQENSGVVFVGTSYYGDQPTSSKNVTSLKNPYSFGLQGRWQLRSDLALQVSGEFSDGETRTLNETKSFYHLSLSSLFYVARMDHVSPFLSVGVISATSKNNGDALTNIYSVMGIGADAYLVNNVVLSGGAKFYSDGWLYKGWGVSLGVGYAL